MRKLFLAIALLLLGSIPVFAAGQSPIAIGDVYWTEAGITLSVSLANGVLANDSDPEGDTISVSSFLSPPSETGVVSNFFTDGRFTFTPALGFVGSTTFYYRASDGTTSTPLTPIVINVTANLDNRPAIPAPDSYYTPVNVTLSEAAPGVLRNDYDPDGDALSVHLSEQPQNGTVTVFSTGAFTYIPATGFTGVDTFVYQVTDNIVVSRTFATVTIYVGTTFGQELLENRSLEADTDGNGIPDGWVLNRANPGDRRACNRPDQNRFFSHNGNCAFRLSSNSTSVLVHVLGEDDTSTLTTGNTLRLSGYYRGSNTTDGGRIQLQVFYDNSALPRENVVAAVPGCGATCDISYRFIETPVVVLDGTVRRIKVKVKYRGTSGLMYFDSLSLAVNGQVAPNRSTIDTQYAPLP